MTHNNVVTLVCKQKSTGEFEIFGCGIQQVLNTLSQATALANSSNSGETVCEETSLLVPGEKTSDGTGIEHGSDQEWTERRGTEKFGMEAPNTIAGALQFGRRRQHQVGRCNQKEMQDLERLNILGCHESHEESPKEGGWQEAPHQAVFGTKDEGWTCDGRTQS